jgi:3-keto steroid reductase
MLARQLFPLLSRDTSSSLHPGRIIWTSSLEAVRDVFDVTDIQGFRSLTPYDGAKRLIDILVLTQSLPSVRPISATYLAPSIKESDEDDDDDDDELDLQPPRMYVTHPGIVTSTLFPCPWFLIGAYTLVLYIARWLGSPWHTTDAYSGASSASWLTLQEQSALDELDAERVKWGSGTDRRGNSVVKKTEVEGWGWEGRVEDLTDEDGVTGVLRKRIGRKLGTQIVRKGDLMEFEELGAECWEQMEDLREEWSEILDL